VNGDKYGNIFLKRGQYDKREQRSVSIAWMTIVIEELNLRNCAALMGGAIAGRVDR